MTIPDEYVRGHITLQWKCLNARHCPDFKLDGKAVLLREAIWNGA